MNKKIGLTMRMDVTPHGEQRISVDTAWFDLLQGMGFDVVLLPYTDSYNNQIEIDGLILSGGNDVLPIGKTYYKKRNDFEFSLLELAIEKNIPVIGICRGMQVMNLFSKGDIAAVSGHVAKPHAVTWNGKSYTVNSFHDYGIEQSGLSSEFEPDAVDALGNIEAFHHKKHNWHGIMWHPERAIDDANIHHTWLKERLLGSHV